MKSRIEQAARECCSWHGCATGDCLHEKYHECFEAVYIEGANYVLSEVEGLVEALEKAQRRNRELDIAMSEGKADLAQEIWKHQKSEIDTALAAWREKKGDANG